MDLTRVKLVDLFEKATSEKLPDPDILINLEIIDRMNSSRKMQDLIFSCAEGIEYFKQLFKLKAIHTVRLAILLLETCIKNSRQHFHKIMHDKGVIELLMNYLKRKRKKLSVVDKMAQIFKAEG